MAGQETPKFGNIITKQGPGGTSAVTGARGSQAGADYSAVNNQLFWDAYLKKNNIIPPFGGGGQAFKDQHLLPFAKFRQEHQIVGGKVVPIVKPQTPGAPAPVATPTPTPVPSPSPSPTPVSSLEDILMRMYYNA